MKIPALLLALFAVASSSALADSARSIPAPAADEAPPPSATRTAVLAGGCFWGVQGVFQHVQGVTRAVSGYAGDDQANADYAKVSRGRTRHAEAVRITYDPRVVSFGRLLHIFFSVAHDPTQRDRQGPDIGPQYRSTIFVQDEEQARLAQAYIDQLDAAKSFGRKIATTLERDKPFFPAEAYHQDYMTLHPTQPYIAIHDLPKVESLKRLFPSAYRAAPALVSKTGL